MLFRADSGLCLLKIMQEIHAQAQALEREIAFIIKWNPRSTPVEAIALKGVGSPDKPVQRIYRLTERTIDKHGNPLQGRDASEPTKRDAGLPPQRLLGRHQRVHCGA